MGEHFRAARLFISSCKVTHICNTLYVRTSSLVTLNVFSYNAADRAWIKKHDAEQACRVHLRATEIKATTVTIKEVSVNDPATDTQPSESLPEGIPDLPRVNPYNMATPPKIKADKSKEVDTDTPEEPIAEIEGITLFSLVNNLQTSLLANLISDQTQLPCVVAIEYTPSISHTTLAVVDCQGRNLEELQELVNHIQNHTSELRTVLLNAVQKSEHEELLDWPCIVGVFFDDTDQEQLTRGLQCLLNGEYWVPRRLLHHFLQKNRRAPNSQKLEIKLTKRESQILKLIKDGATNSDIAKALEVSEHTVKSHLYNVYKKIGVRNRLEANNWVRDIDTL